MARKTSLVALILGLVVAAPTVRGDDAAPLDPSGTWRWEHDEGGETVKNVLKLNLEGEVVTGTYQGRLGPMEVENGKIEGDQLTFQLPIEYDGQRIDIAFKGRIDGDEVNGNVEVSAGGQSQEFPWKATRSLHATDVVGTWALKIELQDGYKLTPTLTLDQDGADSGITGKYVSTNGDVTLEAKDVKIEGNHLHFTITADRDGNSFTAKYAVLPRGDKLSGEIDYDFNGNTGQLEVKGNRKAEI